MADSGGDPWAFSTKGKLGDSKVLIGGAGASLPNISKYCEKVGQKTAILTEKWSRFIL